MDLGKRFFKFIGSIYHRITPLIFIYLAYCKTYTIIDFRGNFGDSLSNYIGFICMASRNTILTKKKDNSLRIISFNVKEFNGNTPQPIGHKLRTEDIAASIQKWDPDIICLQEYNTKELKNDIANHATYFDQKYPYSFFLKTIRSMRPIILQAISFIQNTKFYMPKGFHLPIKKV